MFIALSQFFYLPVIFVILASLVVGHTPKAKAEGFIIDLHQLPTQKQILEFAQYYLDSINRFNQQKAIFAPSTPNKMKRTPWQELLGQLNRKPLRDGNRIELSSFNSAYNGTLWKIQRQLRGTGANYDTKIGKFYQLLIGACKGVGQSANVHDKARTYSNESLLETLVAQFIAKNYNCHDQRVGRLALVKDIAKIDRQLARAFKLCPNYSGVREDIQRQMTFADLQAQKKKCTRRKRQKQLELIGRLMAKRNSKKREIRQGRVLMGNLCSTSGIYRDLILEECRHNTRPVIRI